MKKIVLAFLFVPFMTLLLQAQTATDSIHIDFSHAGYKAGMEKLPQVESILFAKPTGADDTWLLQSAIDVAGKRPLQSGGFRGAIQLEADTFRVAGQLHIHTSGIVIRGTRKNGKATVILATGTGRRTLLKVGSQQATALSPAVVITSATVPAGSTSFEVQNTAGLKKGDHIVIERPSTAAWINDLKMNTASGPFADMRLHWTPGSRNLVWDRVITAVDQRSKQLIIDAPITTALEKRYGSGTVAKAVAGPVIKNIAIEEVVLLSAYDPANQKDEEHAWTGIAIDNAQDVWVRNVITRHFVYAGFHAGARGRRITITGCSAEQPVAEAGGYRRQNYFIEGQQVLVYNCRSEEGMNDFAVGMCAAGPNAFVNCTTSRSLNASGSFESWASGVLYDNVTIDNQALRLTYDMTRAQGGGWTAANAVVWNCKAKEIEAEAPEGASNVVVQTTSSLYHMQLENRTGKANAALVLSSFLQPVAATAPLKPYEQPPSPLIKAEVKATQALRLKNGRFVVNNKAVWGGAVNDAWWLGQTSAAAALNTGISITRFVPGKTGPGLTEDLSALAARMQRNGTPFYQSGPCLWYDRRRDEHSITERLDGNVWAPFYEMPWQRSGEGKAWDGLSKFDLTRYNPWYFNRTRAFAQLSDEHGIVLYHNLYNTHNLLEIGAHWADYPWRPANCINETGLPEPPPLEPHDRLHLANQFYNVDDPNRRRLHHDFIFHVLNELGHNANIIFGVGFQFSGPLDFQQFFLETVKAWEEKNKRPVRIMLSTSKDITDSILMDPRWTEMISVIDMRYWQYRPDGSLWAPKGGQNLAFREMIGREFGKATDAAPPTTAAMAYRQVREYKDRYPQKAIMAWHNNTGQIPALMAGAAQVIMQNPTAGHGQGRVVDTTAFDQFVKKHLSGELMNMVPMDGMTNNDDSNWVLADSTRKNILVYSQEGANIQFTQKPDGKYEGFWYDPVKNNVTAASLHQLFVNGSIIKPAKGNWLLLLKKKS